MIRQFSRQSGAEVGPRVGASRVKGDRQTERAALPGRFEHQLAVLARDAGSTFKSRQRLVYRSYRAAPFK
jgi:hypothetical protein